MTRDIDNLIIAITERCNMNCAHCMRGDGKNRDVTREIIDLTLKDVNYIGSITLTGGEPTLNIDAIEYVLDKCKELDIPVGSFYIVTNGKIVTERFLIACLKWHAYCIKHSAEPEYSGVALSQDKFHEPIPEENIQLLQTLACYRGEDKRTDFDKIQPLGIGRGANIPNHQKTYWKTQPDAFISDFDDNHCNIEMMSVTVDGIILSDCNYAYDDIDAITVGTVFNPNWLEEHIAEYCNGED